MSRDKNSAVVNKELYGHRLHIPDLVDRLFPDEVLPKPVKAIYTHLSASRLYKPGKRGTEKWIECPDIITVPSNNGDVKAELTRFLRQVANAIASFVDEPRNREVTEEFSASTYVPSTADDVEHKRSPALLFFNDGVPRTWETTICPWEIGRNNRKKTKDKVIEQAIEDCSTIFENQDDRRFVPSVLMLGYNIELRIFDRAGEVYSEEFDMRTKPESFLRILTALMFSDREALGYDPAFTTLPNGTRTITIQGKVYEILERVHHAHGIRGRGTNCWHATCDGKHFAIKDCWMDETRVSVEADFLTEAGKKGVKGVPTLVAEDSPLFRGEKDTTQSICPSLQEQSYRKAFERRDRRQHRRLVLEPFAIPITYFRSKKELIKGFIDAITAHRDLLDLAGILHRDISLNNIMLIDMSDGSRKGLLIDLDYAAVYPEPENPAPGFAARTGTTPFMACDLLSANGPVRHQPHWDLESFLYVLIWICMVYSGPNNKRRNFDLGKSRLAGWTGGSFSVISERKSGTMGRLFEKLLGGFPSYFADLKDCVYKWRDLHFDLSHPRRGAPSHDEVLEILQATHDSLPEADLVLDEDQDGQESLATAPEHSGMSDANDIREDDALSQSVITAPEGTPAAEESTGASNINMLSQNFPQNLDYKGVPDALRGHKRVRTRSTSPEEDFLDGGIIPRNPSTSGGSRRSFGTFTPRDRSPSPSTISEHLSGEATEDFLTKIKRMLKLQGRAKTAVTPEARPSKRRRTEKGA
ncbi:hypothetical protein NEOLEDRAFT_1086095 [Neolentinus lepideus HHB14362 ss-1]|uniref:Fungal-type protein kinase domain-containing protein n=1 Tax=Neolentinus lepideus HHB14362 ss-1 TaxID=1314782 RepID=A0A165V487_9AGAM|nr:hypothetical protein NEOLEDRAFT_1086095 [Neolentinus lepideus HHB14362 ss-1]